MTHPVIHWEIGGRDPDVLQRFYGDMFGWSIDTSNPDYGLVETGDGMGGAIIRSQAGAPSHVTIYVQVDDLRSTLDRGRELGAPRSSSRHRSRTSDRSRCSGIPRETSSAC